MNRGKFAIIETNLGKGVLVWQKAFIKTGSAPSGEFPAATSILLCALTVLAQIAVTLLLTHLLKEKASFVYGVLQFIGAVVAIRVYLRTGSPSYKLSWMCLLLALPGVGHDSLLRLGGEHIRPSS